jgi:hypothetical protein
MMRISLAEKERQIAQRKEALGIIGSSYVLPNSGARRSESKRELLRILRREAEARNRAPTFATAIK